MMRRVAGVIAGLLVGMAVISGVEAVDYALFPPPPGFNPNDRVAFNDYVATLPISAFLIVLAAHALGAFTGAIVTTLVAGRASVRPGMIVGAVAMIAGIANVLQISHPVWFSLIDLLLYLPLAYVGAWMMVRRPAGGPEARRP